MTKLIPNATLAYRVLDQIDAHPETWNQSTWDCGTAACFAGWAVRLSGGISDDSEVVAGPDELTGMTVENAAYKVLGITVAQADPVDGWLFDAENDRQDLGRLVAEIFGPRPRRHGESGWERGTDACTDACQAGCPGEHWSPIPACQPQCFAGFHLPGCVYDDVPPNAGSAS
ncbi:hypothetical protein [Actinoplanes palleronii]|uniref:Uncharacterized protein n=1 Tax=Actinoplanes palleronii TaxID=113570 RepID=A0ABQ4B3X7_9ACTN|nr:hypothetical protein [Actinoplanes palleronii]GIE65372.1 hypothetical protein Apa02nite_014800 [Actinoplanes palleronii]